MSPPKCFKKIALLGTHRHSGIAETLLALQKYLKLQGYEVLVEEKTAQFLPESHHVRSLATEELNTAAELIVVVGGDGNMLHAAKIATQQNLPVLGVNRGRLGFLTDIYPHELDKINDILSGNYQEEERFLLSVRLTQNDITLAQGEALNDVVLSRSNVPHLLEFDIYIDQQFVCSQRSDGLIVATPTGSTAYALSGGGPILHPQLDAFVLVPMMPHTLSNRPVVIDANSEIIIKISENNDQPPSMSCDGQQPIIVDPGKCLQITKKKQNLRLIHPLDYNYFATLRDKLRWYSKD